MVEITVVPVYLWGGEFPQNSSSNLPSLHFHAFFSLMQCRAVNQTGSWNCQTSPLQVHQSPIKWKQIKTGSEAGKLQMKGCATTDSRDLGFCEQECQWNPSITEERVIWQSLYLFAKPTAFKQGFCGLYSFITRNKTLHTHVGHQTGSNPEPFWQTRERTCMMFSWILPLEKYPGF